MPGIIGGIGCADPDIYNLLKATFRSIWKDSDFREGEGWCLGGHAFRGRNALVSSERYCYVVDGEYSIYERRPARSDRFSHDFRIDGDVLRLGPHCMGNVALIDPIDQSLRLAAEWSGTFPLYFAQYDGGVLFSSHLRPLARLTRNSVDELGLLEFLRSGFTFAGRSLFGGIRRVLPGQCIRYSVPAGRIEISEESGLWTAREGDGPPEAFADQAWELLAEATSRSTPTTDLVGLMMSGGWDSRTLMAALTSNGGRRQRLICYSHGDLAGRELNLVARLASSNHVKCRLEPVDARVLDVSELKLGFSRVENVVFPHWHRAGRILSDMRVACATAGVYGEVLGGHYGPAMLLGGHRTIMAVARSLIRPPGRQHDAAVGSAEALLRVKPFGHHWYLRRDFEGAIPCASDRMNEDVESDIERLRRRGVASSDQLIEAFIAEHRGSHYINAQILSCRGYVDVALPFAQQALLAFGSRLPLHSKIHNALNRKMLRRHAASMLRLPMAATLVPAGYPVLMQEASRFLRRTYEDTLMALYDRTHGRISPPKLGWVNFEFLRSSNALMHLVDDLQSDCWDRKALEHRLKELTSDAPMDSLYPVYNQLAKIYTVDLLCR